jgi:hypothetical protein
MFHVEYSATWDTLGERADTGLSRLSIFIRPPIGSIMPAMNGFLAKGYFDDSQTSEEIWTIGGYVGGLLHWEAFEALWPLVLATHEVPYFHMREMADPRGVFSKWHPPEDHEVASLPCNSTQERWEEHNRADIGNQKPKCARRRAGIESRRGGAQTIGRDQETAKLLSHPRGPQGELHPLSPAARYRQALAALDKYCRAT